MNGDEKISPIFFSLPKNHSNAQTGTVFLNAAAWPRARELLSSAVLQRRVVPDDGGETEVERGSGGGGGNGNGGNSGGGFGGSREGSPPSSLHHAVVVEVDRGVVTAALDAWVTVSARAAASAPSSSGGADDDGEESKKKKKTKFEATQLELRQLLRTERARGVDEESGHEVFFRSVWRGWTREFELVASRVPRSAPEGWEHWRFRE